jgi:thioredoxin reductase
MYDVIVIGGGPAGLQAALTLGRTHRSCLVLDSGTYRNASAAEMHNFLTHDGTPPSEFLQAARKDLSRYETVEVVDDAVDTVVASNGGFTVTTSAGSSHLGRRLVLATGLRDVLPDVPGMSGLWGTVVAHCPFCHGHELSGGTVAVQGGPHATRLAGMLSRIAGELVVLADGYEFTDDEIAALGRIGAEVRTGSPAALHAEGDGARVDLDDGSSVRVDGFFVKGSLEQTAPFAAALGLATLPSGAVEVDPFGRTSHPGVFAAGDLAHQAVYPMPLASVLNAASAGMLAGVAVLQDLVTDDFALPAAG